MKQIHFMAGLPRSGATLLSSILNQNSHIYCAPQTDLVWQLILLERNKKESETYQLGQRHEGYANVMRKLPHNFYEDISAPIVIDKNRSWAEPECLSLAYGINPNLKMLLPYRPLFEVLASFIELCESNPYANYIDKAVFHHGYDKRHHTLNDARCQWLLDNELRHNMISFENAINQNDKQRFYFVAYNKLTSATATVIEGIYRFLQLDMYAHTYDNIKRIDQYDDASVYGLENMHTVREKVIPVSRDYNKYVSAYIQTKYAKWHQITMEDR